MLAAEGTAIFNALDRDVVEPVFLIDVLRTANASRGITAAAQYYTDSPYPIAHSGNTYTNVGNLQSIDAKAIGGDLSSGRDSVVVQLAGTLKTLRGEWIEVTTGDHAGRQMWNRNRLRIWVTFTHDTSAVLQIFGGKCIQAAEVDTGILLTFSGPLTQVAGIKPFILTHAQQQERDSTDTSLAWIDRVRPIRWGS